LEQSGNEIHPGLVQEAPGWVEMEKNVWGAFGVLDEKPAVNAEAPSDAGPKHDRGDADDHRQPA